MNTLILASQSPRRKELLSTIGVSFDCQVADIDETPRQGERASHYVARLAEEKAAKVLARTSEPSVWVLGSDTSVILDDQILGKPNHWHDFRQMMKQLSGRQHQVLTAVSLVSQHQTLHCLVETDVKFCTISEQMVKAYWDTGEPQDKAGGYGIQGFGSYFVERITGSYSAVVGLPLRETALLLRQAGFSLWEDKLPAN